MRAVDLFFMVTLWCCVLPCCLSPSQMLDLSQLCSSAEDNIRPGLTRHTALAVEWLEAVETILASLPPTNHQPHLENVQRELMILRLHHDQKWRLSLSILGLS